MKSPVSALFQSRKFWLTILDLFISLVMFFGAKYLSASLFEDIKFVIAAIQPVFVTIIVAIAVEDSANAKAGVVYIDGQPYRLKTVSEGE